MSHVQKSRLSGRACCYKGPKNILPKQFVASLRAQCYLERLFQTPFPFGCSRRKGHQVASVFFVFFCVVGFFLTLSGCLAQSSSAGTSGSKRRRREIVAPRPGQPAAPSGFSTTL